MLSSMWNDEPSVPEERYRVRMNREIVGYLRVMNGKSHFFSRDGFWWTGRPLEYNVQDEYVGVKDKNNQHIYEWDLVKYKIDPDEPYREGAVLWQPDQDRFVIRDLEEDLYYPFDVEGLQMFNPMQLEVFSYLFINPDLQELWGLTE